MKLAWKNLCKTDDELADMKKGFGNAKVGFEFLVQLLELRINNNLNETCRDNYDNPNWNLKQADLIGEARAYREIRDLVKSTIDIKSH